MPARVRLLPARCEGRAARRWAWWRWGAARRREAAGDYGGGQSPVLAPPRLAAPLPSLLSLRGGEAAATRTVDARPEGQRAWRSRCASLRLVRQTRGLLLARSLSRPTPSRAPSTPRTPRQLTALLHRHHDGVPWATATITVHSRLLAISQDATAAGFGGVDRCGAVVGLGTHLLCPAPSAGQARAPERHTQTRLHRRYTQTRAIPHRKSRAR